MPAAQIAPGAIGQCRQRGRLRPTRRGHLHHVQGTAQQVAGHDAGGAGAHVHAERQIRLVIDLNRDARPADRPGRDKVRPLTQQLRVEKRRDLPVHRRDRQPGDGRDGVAGDRPPLPDGGEHRGHGRLGRAQGGRDDVGHRVAADSQRVHANRLNEGAGHGESLSKMWIQAKRGARQQHARCAA